MLARARTTTYEGGVENLKCGDGVSGAGRDIERERNREEGEGEEGEEKTGSESWKSKAIEEARALA